ncbi:MAG: VanZ family protein [Proteobacteria bacterium]|nr:VanZ family protein [Pseudomonadota bacterium]
MPGESRQEYGDSRFWHGLKLWGPPAVLSAGIFILSSIPGDRFPRHPETLSMAVHFLEFFVLGFLLARAFSVTHAGLRVMFPVLLLCGGFGLLMELYQFTVPFRSFGAMDILIDILGSMAGGLSYVLLKRTGKNYTGNGP